MTFPQTGAVPPNFQTPIQLIGSVSGPTTGLSRYHLGLQQALMAQGVTVNLAEVKFPYFLTPLVKPGKRFNFDLRGLLTNYPLMLPPQPHGAITHLTSQNQASAVLLSRRKRLVITVHDMITLTNHADTEIVSYLKPYAQFLNNLALPGLKKADFLITDSEYTRQAVLARINYPAEQIRVVYPGIDHERFAPKPIPDDFYQRYNLNPTIPYLLYVGSEDPRKNLHRLVTAFSTISKKFPQARLLKVGTNLFAHKRQELLTQIEELQLTEKVMIFDYVPEEDLVHFYNIARVFVFPSLLEGFGWPPLEAMACGTAVVASNLSCIPEVLGEAALYFNPYQIDEIVSALELVLTEHASVKQLQAKGSIHAKRFTWGETAGEILAIYREVVEKGERHK